MSYNYLPLDHKPLHFQQIKNLLDYNQLVSITFTAHERIIENIEHIRGINFQSCLPEIVVTEKSETSAKVPLEVIKLLLMLKIKSLSYGTGCVQIETIKTMMELYNQGRFPEIDFSKNGLFALYKFIEANSQTTLTPEEKYTLCKGSQFTTAYGLYILIKTEILLAEIENQLVAVNEKEEQLSDKIILKDNSLKQAEEIIAVAKQVFNTCTTAFLKHVNTADNGLFVVEKNTILVNKHISSQALELQMKILVVAMKGLINEAGFNYNNLFLKEKVEQWLQLVDGNFSR